MSTKRLFFGLWPDHRQRDRLRDFITPLAKEVDGRIIDRHKWHVTLAFIGDFEEQLIPSLQKAASEIEALRRPQFKTRVYGASAGTNAAGR